MRRLLSLWLPRLPLDRLRRMGDPRLEGPFALIAQIKNAWRLTYLNQKALQSGLGPEMGLTDARALCPDLLTEKQDFFREKQLLRALCRWSDAFSPFVEIQSKDGLMLDITGVAHLFGGEAHIASMLTKQFADRQIEAKAGIADSKVAAWALAHFAHPPNHIATEGQTAAFLAGLPLAALNLPAAQLQAMRQTGLAQIGQLYKIKTAELARRFGLEVPQILGRALGHEPDPLLPSAAPKHYAARICFPEPIGFVSDIQAALERLADSICKRLIAEQKGARRFELTLHCVDSGDHQLAIGFSAPCRKSKAVLQQFARPLETFKIAFGVDALRLVARQVQSLLPRQKQLRQDEQKEDDLNKLLSSLGNRLGFDHILHFAPRDSHLPENQFTLIENTSLSEANYKNGPAYTSSARSQTQPWGQRARPMRFYHQAQPLQLKEAGRPPKAFEWRYKIYHLENAKGPERLTPHWWGNPSGVAASLRDYWWVQTREGPRFWLLTYPGQAKGGWYMAGQFA